MRRERPTVLNYDNNSCIAIVKNLVFHVCMKHIELQYHFVCEMIVSKEVEIIHCPTIENYEDIFTKDLCRDKLEWLLPRLNIGLQH